MNRYRRPEVNQVCFENLDDISTPYCREMIKTALVGIAYDSEPGVVERMMERVSEVAEKRKVVSASIGVSIAGVVMLLLVFGSSSEEPLSPAAVQAKEVVGQMQQRLAVLPIEKQKYLESLINEDLGKCLQEAINARDLKVIGIENVSALISKSEAQEVTKSSTVILAGASIGNQWNVDGELLSWEIMDNIGMSQGIYDTLVYLYHSDSNGDSVVIGVDANYLPVVRYVVEVE